VGSFSVRIANLEDMMLVSLADSVLDQAEHHLKQLKATPC
jgi:hypothetical protein